MVNRIVRRYGVPVAVLIPHENCRTMAAIYSTNTQECVVVVFEAWERRTCGVSELSSDPQVEIDRR